MLETARTLGNIESTLMSIKETVVKVEVDHKLHAADTTAHGQGMVRGTLQAVALLVSLALSAFAAFSK